MISNEQHKIYLKLQQTVLDTSDNSILMSEIFPQMLIGLSSIGYIFEFISLVLVSLDGKAQQSFIIDRKSLAVGYNSAQNLIKFDLVFGANEENKAKLRTGQILILDNPKQFLDQVFYVHNPISTLLIFPMRIGSLLTSLFVMGTRAPKEGISAQDLEFLHLISNFINMTFRLQDTQSTLIRITQEVYKMNAELRQLDKLKDDFVSIASHELRTPMTAIRSYAWMALNRSDIPLSEKLKKYISRTLVSTERLINLVNDMLNISRIESGRLEILPRAFDIRQLAGEVNLEVEPKAKEKQVNLIIENSNIPLVFADPDKVHQVLLNLIGNALKFTPANGQIKISFFSDGHFTQTSVTDSGVGILSEDLSRLFKKFGRLDNSYVAAATSGGTGLGLFICKSLINLMGGQIKVHSEGAGKGATFSFTLPVATPEVMKSAEKLVKSADEAGKYLEHVSI